MTFTTDQVSEVISKHIVEKYNYGISCETED